MVQVARVQAQEQVEAAVVVVVLDQERQLVVLEVLAVLVQIRLLALLGMRQVLPPAKEIMAVMAEP